MSTRTEKAIMIGDRHHDVTGAIKNSIDVIGVLYGYGSRKELQNAGASYIIDNCNNLAELLKSKVTVEI